MARHRPRVWTWLFIHTALLLTMGPVRVSAEAPPAGEAARPWQKITIDFDHYETGDISEAFTPVLSGRGGKTDWEVRPEPTAPSGTKVLAQTTSENIPSRFPILLYEGLQARDVSVGVRFKPVSGKIDQAAGVIVRFQDAGHFYVAQADALEGEVRFFRVENGVRHSLAGAVVPVATGEWHMLRVVARGDEFQVHVDGRRRLTAADGAYARAGRIGLSTKSDGVTVFDDLEIVGEDVR